VNFQSKNFSVELFMKKVCIMPNWGMSIRQMMDEYKKLSPGEMMRWGDFELVDDPSIADYQIAMDGSTQPTDSSKVIFFGREPTHVGLSLWPDSMCRRVYHHEIRNSWNGVTWWLKLNHDQLTSLKNFEKSKNLSIIDSGKRWFNGHISRVNLINQIAESYPHDVEIWGRITNGRENTGPFKSSLPHKQKDQGLIQYRYNLSIENGAVDYYFSEKFADPLLCWTMPIYWGCPNIEKFFPSNSFVRVDVENPHAKDKIMEISKSNLREENLGAIEEARHLLLTKYSLFPTIDAAINDTLRVPK